MLVSKSTSLAVLHVALEPTSGVWSVMRDVSLAQAKSDRYRAVGIGVVASPQWPSIYAKAFSRLDLPRYCCGTICAFGTAKFLCQRLIRPPIAKWADELRCTSNADQVVVHFHNAWLSGVFLPLSHPNHGRIRVVVTFHGVCTTLQREPVRRWLHRWMAQRLLRFNAILTSVDAANLLLAADTFGLPPERFSIVHNGVSAAPELCAAEWGGAGAFVVGYIGLLAEHKGWSMVADAVLMVRAGGRNVRLEIAGAGPQAMQARSRAEAHPDAITFHGHLPDPRAHLMPRLHVLSLMSTYEGLPMVLIEAASVGLPVVATATGGVRDILHDGATGIVVHRTVEALAAAISDLYDDPARLAGMSRSARALHAQQFEIVKVTQMYHNVYQMEQRLP